MEPGLLGVRRCLVGGSWHGGDVEVGTNGGVSRYGVMQGSPDSALSAIPGMVDLQVNGVGEIDFRTASVDQLLSAARALADFGTVAFMPTLHAAPFETYLDALARIGEAQARLRDLPRDAPPHASILGAHLEGPFLNRVWAGAHDPTTMLAPSGELVNRLIDAGPVAMMTLAPELAGAETVMAALLASGAIVSIGHSDATADQTRRALGLGARMLTHCFNAHRRFSARDPGPAGVGLVDRRCSVGLIGDGRHVSIDTVRVAFAAAGSRIVLTSDLVADAAPGGDGQLRGSSSPLLDAVGHLVASGLDELDVVRSATEAPRTLLGRDPRRPVDRDRLIVVDDDWRLVRLV